MLRVLTLLLIAATLLHGLVHLLGFLAYLPLARFAELPYKTAILGGRIDLGPAGMRAFSLLWLLAAVGMALAAIALALGRPAWAPLLLAAALLSLVLCVLDWGAAFRGALIDGSLLLLLFVVFGLRTPPTPFPAYAAPAGPVATLPLPEGLPAPVERYLRSTYGDGLPVYTSAVISGRGSVRFMGVTFPARLRFVHLPARGYRHYFEATFYDRAILSVNERYLDGRAYFALPFEVLEDQPTQNSAANQGFWAEMIAYPAVYATDPRARWEAVDDATAILHIPYPDEEQALTFHFDPQGGALTRVETLRHRDAKSGKLRWWGDVAEGKGSVLQHWGITWEDEGTPWLQADIEDLVLNSDVSAYIEQTGP